MNFNFSQGFIFQSTLPARGATPQGCNQWTRERDFNPRSPHGERRKVAKKLAKNLEFQSTLPARGATLLLFCFRGCRRISIHAPRTGSDVILTLQIFTRHNFNPRSPHGERRGRAETRFARKAISIHAPRTGSDTIKAVHSIFLHISIHAPRTGSDAHGGQGRC